MAAQTDGNLADFPMDRKETEEEIERWLANYWNVPYPIDVMMGLGDVF